MNFVCPCSLHALFARVFIAYMQRPVLFSQRASKYNGFVVRVVRGVQTRATKYDDYKHAIENCARALTHITSEFAFVDESLFGALAL